MNKTQAYTRTTSDMFVHLRNFIAAPSPSPSTQCSNFFTTSACQSFMYTQTQLRSGIFPVRKRFVVRDLKVQITSLETHSQRPFEYLY